MDKRRLAYELRRYICAQTNREPPSQPVYAGERETEGEVNLQQTEDKISPGNSEELDRLAVEISDCMDCRLSENRTNVVFGEGDVGARVMVVGEGPGANEDEQGLPFVGRSGKLLRQGFEKVGLSGEDIYITNVVKCRPPDNRDPRTDELKACRPYLDQQLELIDPAVILSLGNFALGYFLGEDGGIMDARGETYDFEGYTVVPTFHPSYMLYNPGETKTKQFLSDLKLAVSQLNG